MGLKVKAKAYTGKISFDDYIVRNLMREGNASLPLTYLKKYSLKELSEELTTLCGFPVICKTTENKWDKMFGSEDKRIKTETFLIAKKVVA